MTTSRPIAIFTIGFCLAAHPGSQRAAIYPESVSQNGQEQNPQPPPTPAPETPPAPPAPQASPPPVSAPVAQDTNIRPLRVETRMVQVNVTVLDKHGKPIPGLTKDDFAIWDDRKPQPVSSFSIHTNQPTPNAADPLPADTYTNDLGGPATVPSSVTVILLDALNTAFFDQTRARNQIVKYLRTIQPTDRVALYMLRDHLLVLHDFTSDASRLVEALNDYKGGKLSTDLDTPDTTAQNRWNIQMALAERDAGIDESQAITPDRLNITTEALRLIADHVGGLPGRKSLIWVAGDFPFNIESNNLERTQDGRQTQFASQFELTARALITANVAIYPVDARGLIGGGMQDSGVVQASDMTALAPMRTLAARTGGRAFYSTNDVMGSIRDAIGDSQLTYELGFYPSDVKWDGSFHAIRVKVKASGAQVHAREGYFAFGEAREDPDTRMALMSEAAKGPLQATELTVRTHVSSTRADDQTKLTLAIALDARQFDFEEKNGAWNELIEFAFVQLDGAGKIIRTSRRQFPLSLDADTLKQLMAQSLSLEQDLPILPAAAQLRVIVLDGGRGKIGSVQIPLAPYRSPDKPDKK
ncbi:MAG TPA: VWA domain-containing protein [Candidatus Acidoferrales bacterium]